MTYALAGMAWRARRAGCDICPMAQALGRVYLAEEPLGRGRNSRKLAERRRLLSRRNVMRSRNVWRSAAAAGGIICVVLVAQAFAASGYRILKKFPIPTDEATWDYITV